MASLIYNQTLLIFDLITNTKKKVNSICDLVNISPKRATIISEYMDWNINYAVLNN